MVSSRTPRANRSLIRRKRLAGYSLAPGSRDSISTLLGYVVALGAFLLALSTLGFDLSQIQDPSPLDAFRAALRGEEGEYEGPYRATSSNRQIWAALLPR